MLLKLVFCCQIATILGLFWNHEICYNDIGCFKNNNPFDNSYGELPDAPESIKVRAFLWTQRNPEFPAELFYKEPQSIADSNFDARRPTKMLIHGFESSKDASPVVANLFRAFIKTGDYNVIGIDWSAGAKKFYPKAVANTRVVGAILQSLISVLQAQFSLKLADLHVIGHSLGAHIAGYVGHRVPGIARITGLDPAGPAFTKSDAIVRLDPTDAVYVDAIHSDGAPLQDAGFGTILSMGHKDFYPNGGQVQPGCPAPISTTVEQLLTGQLSSAFTTVSCAHDRAIWYFIESVLNANCQFTAHPCDSWATFKAGNCASCGGLPCPVMGINSSNTNVTGKFYLNTNKQSPFCVGNVSD
ncbi:inactive pancreatic lipase-related protein 1-like [Mya arenaria]|uniref:inactive pancreatic lipase-related protein 1-like n=1 Tax=Mya arenaria TaxID=6604 RepID=UPI0022E3EAA3|nr:inactive pancreatic lipase-related protein 1-like [Mya arenaria]